MNTFISIMIAVQSILVFIFFKVLKSYHFKLALYHSLCMAGMGLAIASMAFNPRIGIGPDWILWVTIAPFAVLAIYGELAIDKVSGKWRKSEQKQVPYSNRAEEPVRTKSKAELEREEWYRDLKRRQELHAMVTLEEIELVIQELAVKTVRPVIWIELYDAERLPLVTSKYGGVPYVPLESQPPSDSSGRQLRLLAQLNLQELPFIGLLPKEGILQFWALNDRLVGMPLHYKDTKSTFRILYHPQVDPNVTEDQVLEKYNPWFEEGMEDNFPIIDEFGLNFSSGVESMGSNNERWDSLFAELWNQRHPDMEVYSLEDLPNAHDMSEYEYRGWENKIGGYPEYVQANSYDDENDVLLLEIPSNSRKDRPISWGDLGIANFFVKEEALAKLDFSDAVYHWDCS